MTPGLVHSEDMAEALFPFSLTLEMTKERAWSLTLDKTTREAETLSHYICDGLQVAFPTLGEGHFHPQKGDSGQIICPEAYGFLHRVVRSLQR